MPFTPRVVELTSSGEVNWTVVPGPCAGWAKRFFGTPDEDRLWNAIAPTMRLDAPDPVQAWADNLALLEHRARQLNERRIGAVRFTGPGTDLTVGILEGAKWLSAGIDTSWGRSCIVNMPTVEVFTTPDWRRVEEPSPPPGLPSCSGAALWKV